jgi:hypothetical protein
MPLQAERSKYPGLRQSEAAVLRLWLRAHEHEYDFFSYNVRVGPGLDPGPAFSAATRKSAIDNSQKRIDAVGWSIGHATLIEVKDFALMEAIAQISLYSRLWANARTSDPLPRLLIVCRRAEPGFSAAAAGAAIGVDYVA